MGGYNSTTGWGVGPWSQNGGWFGQDLAAHRKSRTEQGDIDYLLATAPGQAPDLTSPEVRPQRMRIGMNRAATFLTGLPSTKGPPK